MMIRRSAFAAVLFLFSSAVFADVTGTWNGTLSGPISCTHPNDTNVTFSAELGLSQSGSFVTGALQLSGNGCSGAETFLFPINASASGSTFSGSFPNPDGSGQALGYTASASGSSMSFSFENGDGGTLSGTLTQTSTTAPASALTGTYSGTYTTTMTPCGKLAPITFSGSVTATLIQSGSATSGSFLATGDKQDHDDGSGNCTVVDIASETFQMSGTVNGSTISGVLSDEHNRSRSFTATVNGTTISGSLPGDYPGDSTTFSLTRSSTSTPAPVIAGFTASPSTIAAGDSSTLAWSTINAASVSIDNGIGAQPASGSVSVSPAQTTTYTLTASGIGGTSTMSATVTVTAGQPKIVVGQLPSGMIETPGSSGATDSFTLTNAGHAPGSVTLTQSGSFFTISPATFTLAPGASEFVTITANSQAAGTYDGTITVSGGPTVPVHLLVSAPPTAPVNPTPANARSDVSAPAGQNPSGSVSFTNNGTGGLTGIAVSDVPWMIPQSGAINIGPAQTVTVGFTIDRSRRPDASSPAGGLAGNLSLVYLKPASSKVGALGNAPTGSVSVTIVDVVKPNVAPGAPPPLKSGELALFVDGLRTAPRFNGDLTISSRPGTPSISDLQVYLSGAGSAQVSALPAFASGAALAFPAIAKNVFGVATTAGGSLQVRSSQTPNIALSGVISLNSGTPDISSAASLPVLRSDHGIGSGEKLVFSAVQDSATALWLQEVSGNPGHLSIQYLDANGATIGADSGDFPAFGTGLSAAPDGARAAVVTNDSTGGGRFEAFAEINDDVTGSQWTFTDPLHHWGSASGPLIMPVVPSAANDVYVTNTTSTPAAVTVEFDSGARRHAVRPAGGSAQSMTVAPMATAKTTIGAATGFVRISSANAVTAAGRVNLSSSGASFGSGLPAVPASAALASGQGRRFSGVDDASAKSVAAKTPQTYKSTLDLIETTGQSATVRVTLTYTFVAGSTVSSQGVSSRDFTVDANEMLTIGDLARAIIGPQRKAFGDLRNMQVDVDVTGGSGKVLPFIESVDDASGDIIVRAE